MSAAFVVEAVDAIMSAALANLDGLEVVELLSPARSAFGIAFDLTDQFKSTPRTGVQSQARARLEGYVSTPVKEGQPRSPAGDSSPRLLSEGRAAKLHIENEAKRQAAECARAKEVERARSLSDWLKEKVSHALEKREEVLTGVSQKAKRHAEAVEGKLRRVQEAEEHRREELKAKLEPSHTLEKRKYLLAEVSHKAKKHAEAVEGTLRRVQEAEEHRREELKAKLEPSHALEKRKEVLAQVSQKAKMRELKAKLEPSHALEKRKEVLAQVSQKAKKHAEAVEGTLRRVKEAEEHRREELKAKLERKTGSNVSGKVSAGLQPPAGAALKRFQPPARAGGEAVLSPRPLSEPELQSGWVIITEATEQAA
ncbi:unnamed protein product [Prorocentrum cordatum]|uniref:Uncharacterized protein n=1 Tax=Prorocentrum cordatum TaxID=2364126 RepID=A0ABN9Y9D7_9DINO|nr:unnamed protein product [Polarella glacialis]